ncbi:MAG: hypothetical protein J2O46_10670, partial [Nocardioides sp.]|nr:hypothetical protein [Nocardioides sp.]
MADSDAERDRDQPGEQPKELFPPTYAPIELSKPPAPSGVPGPPPPTSGRAGLVVGALLLAVVVLVVAAGVVAWRLLAGHPSDGTGRPAAAPTPTTAGRPSAPRVPSTPPTTAAPSAGPWVMVTSKKD